MTYTEFDIKLIRHALDTNSEGEAGNAAAMFFKELRKRGVKAHEFLETKGEMPAVNPSPYSEWNIDYKERYKIALRELSGESALRFRLQLALEECRKELACKKSWFKF